jgi:predicted site-specific integrase-resolvase
VSGYITLREATQLTGYSLPTLTRWLRRGCCPSAEQVGGTWVLDTKAVADMVRIAEARRAVSKPS